MGLISFTQLVDGSTAVNAASVNNPLSTIYNEFNGNITDANIKTGAAIAGSKIAYATVSNPYKFSVYRNAAATTSSTGAVIPFDTKLFDTGTNIDVVTNKGRFTAPVAGFYCFSGGISIQAAASSTAYIAVLKNGSELYRLNASVNPAASTQTLGLVVPGITVSLAANDYIELSCTTSVNTENINVGGPTSMQTFFSGFLVSAT